MRMIGPDGKLHDFSNRGGDPRARGSNMQRWGFKQPLSSDGLKFGFPNNATVVSTGDLQDSYPINIQFRFATADPITGQPTGQFLSGWPFPNAPDSLNIKIRRTTDPLASFTEDNYVLQSLGTLVTSTVPFDIITSRMLGIDVQFVQTSGLPNAVWVECLATIVTNISEQNRINGWNLVVAPGAPAGFIAAVASPADGLLLRALPQRVQFSVTNLSDNADLVIAFGGPATWVSTVQAGGNIVLPARTATIVNRYDGPVGGFTGEVRGSWNNAAPTGGALVWEGSHL